MSARPPSVHGRRQALNHFAGLSLIPLMAAFWPQQVLAGGSSSFEAPVGEMRLSRQIIRGLADGAQINIRRGWNIAFKRIGAGYEVAGKQASVEVEAPPALSFLAEIERSRQEMGLFPLRLDPQGMIILDRGPADQRQVEHAVDLALQKIAHARLGSDPAQNARAFLTSLQEASGAMLTALPADLFCPRQRSWQESRTLPLPGGSEGTLSVQYRAKLSESGGLMQRAERKIITTIGSSHRTSEEIWQMAPA